MYSNNNESVETDSKISLRLGAVVVSAGPSAAAGWFSWVLLEHWELSERAAAFKVGAWWNASLYFLGCTGLCTLPRQPGFPNGLYSGFVHTMVQSKFLVTVRGGLPPRVVMDYLTMHCINSHCAVTSLSLYNKQCKMTHHKIIKQYPTY